MLRIEFVSCKDSPALFSMRSWFWLQHMGPEPDMYQLQDKEIVNES